MYRIPLRALLLAALLPPLAACGRSTEPTAATLIRVANRTPLAFERVVVDSPGGRAELGSVAPGRSSEYRPVEEAYPFPYIEVETPEGSRVLQPIDFMDPPLEPGRYTYELEMSSTEPFLRVRLASP